jgi:hypothetical protein
MHFHLWWDVRSRSGQNFGSITLLFSNYKPENGAVENIEVMLSKFCPDPDLTSHHKHALSVHSEAVQKRDNSEPTRLTSVAHVSRAGSKRVIQAENFQLAWFQCPTYYFHVLILINMWRKNDWKTMLIKYIGEKATSLLWLQISIREIIHYNLKNNQWLIHYKRTWRIT